MNGSSLGRWGEDTVESFLTDRGWHTHRSPGSKGSVDIFAFKDSHKWCIQVKARITFEGTPMSKRDERRFLEYSVISCCTPVVALIYPKFYDLLKVATNRPDELDSSIVRDILGNFVTAEVRNGFALHLYDLRTGKNLEP